MLLYMLVQAFLGLPQLLCKMPLKTSSEMHYHGADGIHIGYDRNTKSLPCTGENLSCINHLIVH